MAKGKSQNCTWFCSECNTANDLSHYPKNRNEEIVKELKKFCSKCRAHVIHKRKDTKKGN
ncbi:50S ribosomal protein L33 [Candidatus Peregrinibacteria bacterium CG10_big_fil_rev_8_21_14_0_10_36_19]|nr:MAG: 50S ribosomal protein L33 [Candidatus Peregrinibacteria bacterium CG10_big_fil_rev_8_21_14_0_10_36_19]